MTWSEEVLAADGAKFKAEVLPLSNMTSLEDSEVIGLSSAAPTVENSGVAPRSGGLEGAAAGGGFLLYSYRSASSQRRGQAVF